MFHLVFVKSTTQRFASDLAKCSGHYLLETCEKVAIMVRNILWLTGYRFHDTLKIFINNISITDKEAANIQNFDLRLFQLACDWKDWRSFSQITESLPCFTEMLNHIVITI